MQIKQCSDCRDGEHNNIDNDVKLVVIKDPDTNKIYKRSYMCEHHRFMYDSDGFDIYIQ